MFDQAFINEAEKLATGAEFHNIRMHIKMQTMTTFNDETKECGERCLRAFVNRRRNNDLTPYWKICDEIVALYKK